MQKLLMVVIGVGLVANCALAVGPKHFLLAKEAPKLELLALFNQWVYGDDTESRGGELGIEAGGEEFKSIILKGPKDKLLNVENKAPFSALELENNALIWKDFTKAFPEGTYQLSGKNRNGKQVSKKFSLNYDSFPARATITAPAHKASVPAAGLVVTWNAPPPGVNIDGIDLWIGSLGEDELEFEIKLDPAATNYTIPAELLRPGTGYVMGVHFRRAGEGVHYTSGHVIEFAVAGQ